jgi:hypothetical protein
MALNGVEPNVGAALIIQPNTSKSMADLIENWEIHLQSLKKNLEMAQNRMKVMADKNRSNLQFQVGDRVLLKLQPYTQTSIASRPFPKLSFKYFGPFKIVERVDAVAYQLELPPDSRIHDVFHVSQLKPFLAYYSPVYSELPVTTDIEAAAAMPEQILDRHLMKKGNTCWNLYGLGPITNCEIPNKSQKPIHVSKRGCGNSLVPPCLLK